MARRDPNEPSIFLFLFSIAYRRSFNTFVLFQISDNNNSCSVKQLFRRRRKWNARPKMNLSNTCRIFADLPATIALRLRRRRQPFGLSVSPLGSCENTMPRATTASDARTPRGYSFRAEKHQTQKNINEERPSPQSQLKARIGSSGRKVGQRSACLTVLPVLHSLKLCSSGAALATNVCPAWRVLTSESVKDVKVWAVLPAARTCKEPQGNRKTG